MSEGKITYLQEDSTESSLVWALDKDLWTLTFDRSDSIQKIQLAYGDIDAIIAMHLFTVLQSLSTRPEKSSDFYYMTLQNLTVRMKKLELSQWANEEGYDIAINDSKISLGFTDIGVLQMLIASHNVQSLVLSNIEF